MVDPSAERVLPSALATPPSHRPSLKTRPAIPSNQMRPVTRSRVRLSISPRITLSSMRHAMARKRKPPVLSGERGKRQGKSRRMFATYSTLRSSGAK